MALTQVTFSKKLNKCWGLIKYYFFFCDFFSLLKLNILLKHYLEIVKNVKKVFFSKNTKIISTDNSTVLNNKVQANLITNRN